MSTKLVSAETKQRLIRYADAVRRYETERRVITDSSGGTMEIPPSTRTLDEYLAARANLVNCREPEIAGLVSQMQIERIDEAMVDKAKTQLDVIAADHNAQIANNELIHLGHKFRAEHKTKIQPHRRRRDGRRSRSTTRRTRS